MESQPLLSNRSSTPNFRSSLIAIVKCTKLNVLNIFVPIGLLAGYLQWSNTAVFVLNFFAIIPLAKLLGFATEELSLRTNQTLGGLLNATFGNLVEMIVSIFALKEGLIKVVQASLLGSILSNLLLVLGLSFFCGGLYHQTQEFNITAAQTGASLMNICLGSILLPSAFNYVTNDEKLMLDFSRVTSLILLLIYLVYLYFQLHSHSNLFEEDEDNDEEPTTTAFASFTLLVVSTLFVAGCAEYLVGSIEGISEDWNLSKTFVGIILLPIVGNAAEHLTAVTAAMHSRMALSLGVALGSSMQIALLVIPFTVIAGFFMNVPMDLHFTVFETAVLFISVFVVNSIISDGKSNYLEGVLLLGLYVIVGFGFFVMPEVL
ncbi:hypothetical protein HDU92_005879 [Lobulomyces angularis]|nr:hypothetical protein HDU92_005879 [Lobulomyces angularis]